MFLHIQIINVDTHLHVANMLKHHLNVLIFVKASFLTTKRILTCNPLFKPKYDPVPEKKIKQHKDKNKKDNE